MSSTIMTDAVIRVGDARGFIAKDLEDERIVYTAAHCLPFFPPCHAASYLEERTYKALLGPLGQEPTVWAECLFVDPIGDIAVLGPPDGQELYNEWNAYKALVGNITPLRIADVFDETSAKLLSLDGEWFSCKVHSVRGGPFWITHAAKGIVAGMSGSPILAEDGLAAIGIVSVSAGGGDDQLSTEGGPSPRLAYHLPRRFLPHGYEQPKPRPNADQ
jgi:hypothetical protein